MTCLARGDDVLGPIFSVEMLTAGRRTRYFAVRVTYAVVLLIALWISYESTTTLYSNTLTLQQVANVTSAFFASFSWLQLLCVVMLTPAMVSGTIAQEHERRTIEYLLVSPLGSREIVLGKLAARLLVVGFQLLAGLPVLALAMMLGGIGPEALLMVFLVTLITLLDVAALSMAVSTWTRRTRDAVTRTYLVLLAWLIVPWFMAVMLEDMPSTGILGEVAAVLSDAMWYVLALNPFALLGSLDNTLEQAGGWLPLVLLVAAHLVFTLVCLAAAVVGVRRVGASEPVKSKPGGLWRWPQWRPVLGQRAMIWKELFAERGAISLGWPGRVAAVLLIGALLLPTLWMFGVSALATYAVLGSNYGGGYYDDDYLEFVTAMAPFVACIGLLFTTARAAGTITSEKERDCWTTLISTPLPGREIVLAKIYGVLYASRWWLGMLVLMYSLAIIILPKYALLAPFQLGTVGLMTLFCTVLGTHCSLVSRSSLRAMSGALVIVIVLGGAYLFCCVPVMFSTGPGDAAALIMAPSIAFQIGIVHAFGLQIVTEGLPSYFPEELIAAYVLGMLGYLVVTFIMIANLIDSFDRHSGRTDLDYRYQHPPRDSYPTR